jgi:aerobic carbon-monoxide dehydrogenase large subunit
VTTFSQIVAQELGVDMEHVEVIHSDSHGVPYGQGSYGSRTYSVEGAAVYMAAQIIKRKAMKVGAHLLQVAEEDVVYGDAKVYVKGEPDRAMTLAEIGSAL